MNKNLNLFKIKAIRHQLLLKNISYLSLLQVLNIFLPLVTYPYLLRVLGKETYGLVVYAQAIIGYLLILITFGFNITATKEISVNRGNKQKLTEIVNSVQLIKAILLLLCIVILTIVIQIIPQAQTHRSLFYLSMWICVYEIIFPVWYFQGIEQMKYITIISSVSRLLFVSLIFIFVRSEDDYLLLPVINGLGALFAGAYSLYIIYFKHGISFKLQSIENLGFYFKESVPIFISNLSVKVYVNSNKILIGAVLGMAEVAFYDLGEKIVSILKLPQSILSQALFPKSSNEKNIAFIKKIFRLSLVMNILLSAAILISARYIVLLLGGETMLPAVVVIQLLSLTIPLIGMSNVLGVQVLIPFGKTKLFSAVIMSSGIVYLFQLLLVWKLWEISIYSVSIITVLTEVVVTLVMYYACKESRLW
ncbi:MAG: oligosaccharide flippase family protein [Candidatus Scalindua sp.]|jgi:O-antigen/teichoic acid export membrane protein|nr:oligosaccharide flippase family protein [Candidatus Scalindua sp.]